jgi:UDP-N-acetylmuramyl pentapeptide phosphotransferase/UDP-N-acetylglucosamine-1-phosphate transferase
MNSLLAAAIIPALVAAAVLAALRASAWAQRFTDHPNDRSLHTAPTPRIGGQAIALAVIPFALWHANGPLAAIFGCAAALAALSAVDDLFGLPVQVRLPAHVLAALLSVLALSQSPESAWPWGWSAAAAAVLCIAWAANLFNFMDGADGLAGGMAAIGFAALAIAAHGAAVLAPLALLCTALASAAFGFLVHNFPPARVFLGDSGSIPLGFLGGALGLYGVVVGAWPAWFPLLVFSPFVVDATATLALRLVRGERVWIAHRQHAYQRLAIAGWPRRRLAFAAFTLMAAAAVSALVALRGGEMLRCVIIFVWAAVYALGAISVGWLTRRKA